MSAFLCTNRHIAALANMAAHHGIISGDMASRVKFGRKLLLANLKSLNARYGKRHGFHSAKNDGAHILAFGEKDIVLAPSSMDNAVTCAQVSCFNYQSCEDDSYYRSTAYKLLSDLFDACARAGMIASREYGEAPWGI